MSLTLGMCGTYGDAAAVPGVRHKRSWRRFIYMSYLEYSRELGSFRGSFPPRSTVPSECQARRSRVRVVDDVRGHISRFPLPFCAERRS